MAEPNNNQMAFWEAMKEKYERRNECLRKQEECLKKRLEQLRQIMEKQQAGDDCDCVPEKLEKPSLVQCLVEKGRNLILGSCKCGDPKVGEDLLCACHIQDPKAPLNVDPNLCPMQEPSPPEGCLNPSCDFYDPTLANLTENPSTFSLKTTDVYYMDKLADLLKSEKHMQDQIEDLERREHSYLTAIHDLQEAMKKKPKPDPMSQEFKKLTEGLVEENKKLRNELDDLRLELKHCFERVEGPLKRSFDDQRDKCHKLENQLNDLRARTKMKEDSYLKEINEVKAKLCQACCTMVDLNGVNSKLKDDLGSLQDKCINLEDELLKQQLKEAENILKFKTALSKRSPKKIIQAKGDEYEELSDIAKKLGETLNGVCPCVSDVPSGLAETAENIRQLTEFVGEKGAQQRKRRKGKTRQINTSSCSCGSDTIEPKQIETTQTPKKIESCTCSTSSLRLKPRIGKNDFGADQFGGSSSATLASIPTMDIGAPQLTSTPRSSLKKTASKGCTCCPTPNECGRPKIQQASVDTLCCCSDVENKKIGPSEEVIAVKNLGTLSIPPGGMGMSKMEDSTLNKSKTGKMVVNTTCDVLEVPPKDIHVVTTIAETGSLEITTEGPPGIIETKVNYLPDGKIEIVTKLIDRHNMGDFMDGTLLQIPEGPPDCDESHTCGGQCDQASIIGCPEIDCDKSKTCGGVCSEEAELKLSDSEKEVDKLGDDKSPYGQAVLENTYALFDVDATNPFTTKEWKNTNYRKDSADDHSRKGLVITAKPKGNRLEKAVVHADVMSEPDMLRLKSKQSLTDVEKSQEEKITNLSISSVLTEVLDTITEGDEDQTDSSQNEDTKIEAVKEEILEHTKTSDVLIGKRDGTDEVEENENEPAAEVNKESHDVNVPVFPSPIEGKNSLVNVQSRASDINDENQDTTYVFPSATESLRALEKTVESSTNLEEVKEIQRDCQITKSFYKLSRNLNVSNGRVTLKQSKSMYEKRGNSSEYVRICKSAILSLGSLKIDLESLKMSSKDPNVGDNSETKPEDTSMVLSEDDRPKLKMDDAKESIRLDVDGKTVPKVIKEVTGCNPPEIFQGHYEQTYQCYVCSCDNQKEKDADPRNDDQNENNRDLAQRIDRLLEIDPLSTNNAQRTNATEAEDCDCSKKKQDAADPMKKRCRCRSGKKKNPQQQGDNLQHDENCTCVDCICDPCNFKKGSTCNCEKCEWNEPFQLKSLMPFALFKPQQITVMNVTMPCDCGAKCMCNPCMDVSKRPRSRSGEKRLSQTMVQPEKSRKTPCNRCAGRVPQGNVATKPSKIKPEPKKVSPGAGVCLPDTWKSVVATGTSSPDDKKAVCDCNPCECKPCGYAEKARKCDCRPPKKDPKKNEYRGKCACEPCNCKVCRDLTIRDAKRDLDKSMTCCCQLCECLFCSDPKFRKESASVPQVKTEDAKPQSEEPAKVSPAIQEKICGCKPKCLCKSCPVQAEIKAEEPKLELKPQDEVPINVPLGIQEKTCVCKPKCLCESCPVHAEMKMEGHNLGFQPQDEEPTKVPLDLQQKTCACKPKCLCESCPAYAEMMAEEQKSGLQPQDQEPLGLQEKTCACKPKCLCESCPVYAEIQAEEQKLGLQPQAEKIGDAEGNTCDCDKCECDPCFESTRFISPVVKSGLDELNFGITCDCESCKCDDCLGRRPPPIAEKNKGDHPEDKVETPPKKSDQKKICLCGAKDINDKVEKCSDCMCPSIEVIKPADKNIPKLIPCDCPSPCICSPCPDPKVKNAIVGDADRAREEIKNVLNKIGCTCDQVEVNFKPLVKQASNFETTVSKMKLKLNNLQQKCKDKDQIIDAMTNELKMRSESGVFGNLLHNLAHPKQRCTPDFTRTYVCDFLPKPKHVVGGKLQQKRSSVCRFDNRLEPILELDRYLPGPKEDFYVCPRNMDVSGLEIIDIRRVTIDSILIKWRCPSSINGVTGYQIFVNEELKYRVLSPNRTNAVIDSLDLSSSLEIMLFAITSCGRCEPPALATYKI